VAYHNPITDCELPSFKQKLVSGNAMVGVSMLVVQTSYQTGNRSTISFAPSKHHPVFVPIQTRHLDWMTLAWQLVQAYQHPVSLCQPLGKAMGTPALHSFRLLLLHLECIQLQLPCLDSSNT
jgi:hypothetical protein